MPTFQNLAGHKFGRWTVIKRDADYRPGIPQWLCRCSCGREGVVRAGILKSGQSQSCGCLNSDLRRAQCIDRNTTHGQSKTRTYDTWANMISRCHNPKARGYQKYGAKGIKVCLRWRDRYENFLSDMGTIPDGMTIDRIKNSKGYEPGNCRWATMQVQQNNRTNNFRITFKGQTMTLNQWAVKTGIARKTISQRIYTLGWTVEDALTLKPSPLAKEMR